MELKDHKYEIKRPTLLELNPLHSHPMATIHYGGSMITQWNYTGTVAKKAKTSSASASPPKPPVICPWCKADFQRRQELERHSLSLHLPCWIFCPHPSCRWRGTRKEELRKHMANGHGTGTEPKPEEFMIYDTKWIFDFIFDKSTDTPTGCRLRDAIDYALDFVGERMLELQKTELWSDHGLWGRQLKGA